MEKKKNTSNEKYEYFKHHRELNKNQKLRFKEKLNKLKENECYVIVDFKENFKIGEGSIEGSQLFYNISQVSCLVLCLIYKEKNMIKKKKHWLSFQNNYP